VSAGPRTARLDATKHWAGYGWFMSFGTLLPLVVFLGSYVVHLTLVGAPVARRLNRFGIWISTFGQEPPAKGKLESRKAQSDKKSLVEHIRPYSPGGYVARRGRPMPIVLRALWFLLVGWWLGAIWVILSWSVFLAPYPFLDTVAALLAELPSVMTLSEPRSNPSSSSSSPP
jgi:uncharacterized membrane protein YccF (DUF307 family)